MAKAKKKEELSLEEKLEQALVPVEEQPYKVPDNWCWVYSLKMFDIEYGKGLPTKNLTEDGYPVFGANGQIGYYSEYMYEDEKALMSCRGAYSGTMNQSLPKSYVTSNSLIIEDKSKVMMPKYICYMYEALDTSKLVSGSAQPQVTVQAFEKYPVPLPPLAEQKRIVEQIERLFVQLDDVKEKAQAVIEGIDINIEAIFCDAFEGHLTNEWRSKNGITDAWDDTDLSKIVSGLKYGSSEKSDYENKGTPVLRIPNIGDGVVEFSDLKYLSEEIDNTSHEVFENDILVIRSNGSRSLVGRCALVPKLDRKYAYASFLIRLKVSNRVLPQYLVYFLNSSIARIQLFSKAKSSSGIHNINSKELGAIKIKIPSLKEQEQILLVIDSLIKKEKRAREIAEVSIDSVDRMKKSILAKAFRGELGTNNPDEESAVELLKSILEQEE